MGETFWTYFLGTIGLVVFVYIVVMTPVHMVRNARAARAGAAGPDPTVDEHEAFSEAAAPARPHLTIVR
jgi:hypothetical protein